VPRHLQRVAAMPAEDLYEAGQQLFRLMRQARHSHNDRAQLARLLLARGHA